MRQLNYNTHLLSVGTACAFFIALLLVGEIFVFALFPRPETVLAHFELFGKSWLVGLLTMDLLGLISYILFIPLSLALFVVVRKHGEMLLVAALVLFYIGIADFMATNTAFSVLSLSREYAAASTQTEREDILAAGRAMFTLFNENAFLVSYVMVSAAWVILSVVMLRSTLFTRLTSWAGVLAGLSGIIAVILEHVTSERPVLYTAIGFYFAAIVFLFIWVTGIGAGFRRLTGTLTRRTSGD
jgi:hypothetical protein